MATQLIVTRENVADGLLPVRHLSPSSIRAFLQSENLFFKKYVRLEFDEKGKPSMLVGKAAHETVEIFWKDIMRAPETIEACENQLGDGTDSGLKEKISELQRSEGHIAFYQDRADEIFSRMLEEERDKAANRLGFEKVVSEDPETTSNAYINASGEYVHDADTLIEAEAIEWSKTVDEEKCREQLATAIRNYIENADTSTTVATETMETVEFRDLEGEIMPLPIKGVIDRLETHPEHGQGLRDYKFVASFSDQDSRNAGYELQGAAYYFVYQGITGRAPDYVIFEEVLKKEPGYILAADPTRKLLQADLRELCDMHGLGWEKFEKNAQLQDKLAFAKVLTKESSVRRIVYKYAERRDILEVFLEIYKRILNRLGLICLFSVPYDELVNPFDQMNGKEAWDDFTIGIGQGTDTKKKAERKEGDESALENYDF
jgi:hypothetical protein